MSRTYPSGGGGGGPAVKETVIRPRNQKNVQALMNSIFQSLSSTKKSLLVYILKTLPQNAI